MAFIALLPVLSEKSWIPKKTKNTADDNKCTLKFILSCFEISVWTLFCEGTVLPRIGNSSLSSAESVQNVLMA